MSKLRGFQAFDPGYQRQVASMGGKARAAKKVGHFFTSEEAREAGRKGGIARGIALRALAERRNDKAG